MAVEMAPPATLSSTSSKPRGSGKAWSRTTCRKVEDRSEQVRIRFQPDRWPTAESSIETTHRSHAWGVLGLAIGGSFFLLTHPVVFRSCCPLEHDTNRKVSLLQ